MGQDNILLLKLVNPFPSSAAAPFGNASIALHGHIKIRLSDMIMIHRR